MLTPCLNNIALHFVWMEGKREERKEKISFPLFGWQFRGREMKQKHKMFFIRGERKRNGEKGKGSLKVNPLPPKLKGLEGE